MKSISAAICLHKHELYEARTSEIEANNSQRGKQWNTKVDQFDGKEKNGRRGLDWRQKRCWPRYDTRQIQGALDGKTKNGKGMKIEIGGGKLDS